MHEILIDMEKLATNVDEQIAKLESRGMTIGDKNLSEAISNGPLGYLSNSKTQLKPYSTRCQITS